MKNLTKARVSCKMFHVEQNGGGDSRRKGRQRPFAGDRSSSLRRRLNGPGRLFHVEQFLWCSPVYWPKRGAPNPGACRARRAGLFDRIVPRGTLSLRVGSPGHSDCMVVFLIRGSAARGARARSIALFHVEQFREGRAPLLLPRLPGWESCP